MPTKPGMILEVPVVVSNNIMDKELNVNKLKHCEKLIVYSEKEKQPPFLCTGRKAPVSNTHCQANLFPTIDTKSFNGEST